MIKKADGKLTVVPLSWPPLLPNNSVLITEISFDERKHSLFGTSLGLLPRIVSILERVSSLESVL